MPVIKPLPVPEASSITTDDPRWCQWCGAQQAEVFGIDGSWCSPEHRDLDRQSETTWWMRSAA